MEDSFNGMLVSFAIIGIFILGITNFILMFPTEQGFVFTEVDNETYLTLNDLSTTTTITNLSSIDTSLSEGYEDWDIEIGYMGSNTQKSSKSTSNTYYSNVISTIQILANEVFSTTNGSSHPVIIVLGILSTLGVMVGTIVFIKFIRTGY